MLETELASRPHLSGLGVKLMVSRAWRFLLEIKNDSRGLTTAEYAVGTVAACGAGGVLLKLLLSDSFQALLSGLITRAMSQFLG